MITLLESKKSLFKKMFEGLKTCRPHWGKHENPGNLIGNIVSTVNNQAPNLTREWSWDLASRLFIYLVVKANLPLLYNRRKKDILILMYKVKFKLLPQRICDLFTRSSPHPTISETLPLPLPGFWLSPMESTPPAKQDLNYGTKFHRKQEIS